MRGGRFDDLHAWMALHLDQPLTLADLADKAAMSARSFSRHYRQATGRDAGAGGGGDAASRRRGGCWKEGRAVRPGGAALRLRRRGGDDAAGRFCAGSGSGRRPIAKDFRRKANKGAAAFVRSYFLHDMGV